MSKRWIPEIGEKYFCVDIAGLPFGSLWDDGLLDKMAYQQGNCFKTKEEAEAAAEKVKALLLSLHEEQPITDCNHLPKLTSEVFDRPDCPEWAKYAVVDQDGTGVWVASKPSIAPCGMWWDRTAKYCPMGHL